MRDTKLPFGSRLAPGIFHRLKQAVKRMMARRGFTATVAYLDDFFICAPTVNECATALSTLIRLLRQLGFRINWNKVVDQVQCITFLGIEIDSKRRSVCHKTNYCLLNKSCKPLQGVVGLVRNSCNPLQGN